MFFSGNACRDVSCLIFKHIEQKDLGVSIESEAREEVCKRVVIAFVDDSDFMSSGKDSERKMNQIMRLHVDLHEATGGKVQLEKVMVYGFKWENHVISNEDVRIVIGSNVMQMLDVRESTKTLGVFMSPALDWKDEFSYVKRKMETSITKLMNTELAIYQVYMYFNVYMLTNVFYGCGIVKFTEEEIRVLKDIYEKPMVQKLSLGVNFPRKLLYVRKDALGVGLMEPQTVIDLLAIKLYVGNKRREQELGGIINVHEDMGFWDSGLKRECQMQSAGVEYWKNGWVEDVHTKLESRGMKLVNDCKNKEVKTKNRSIMEWAIEYVKSRKKSKKEQIKVLRQLNLVRQHKELLLPCELFGLSGKYDTQCAKYFNEKSLIQWNSMERYNHMPTQ